MTSFFIRFICVVFAALFLGGFVTSPSVAQTPIQGTTAAANMPALSPLILTDRMQTAPLSGKFYVIPDPEHDLTVRLISERLISGAYVDKLSPHSFLNLGLESVSTWLVLPVTNVSSSDIWTLDFGNTSGGRQTTMKGISVYSSFVQRVIYESLPDVGEQAAYSVPNKLRVNLPVGRSGFIIIEMRNPAGTLSTVDLSLKRTYYGSDAESFGRVVLTRIPLICGIILLTVFALRRNFACAAFGAAWLASYTLHYLVDHYIFIAGISAEWLIPGLWLAVAMLLLLGFWLSDGDDNHLPMPLFAGLGFFCLVCGVMGLLVSGFMPLVSAVLSYGPLAIVALLMVFMSWILAVQLREQPYYLMLATGLSLGVAMLCYCLSAVIPSVEIIRQGGVAGFSLAAVMTAAFALVQGYHSGYAPPVLSAPAAQSRDLADAKENAEHKRLLQVLEQERATMSEMQVQEARRTEEMRKAKEAADEANNAKSAFLAVVSHEIRTPMTGIMGMVRLLLDTSLSKDQKDYTQTIQDSGEALMALLNDILDFEKIESGKLELEKADFDIHRLLRGVQTLMNGHAASKAVELKLEIDPKLPHYIVGDPTRLRQVLLNLVNNAIKFTSKGTVWIRVNDMTPEDRWAEPVHQLYFAIQDSGIGIAPEAQKKLFMPFAQADSSTSRKYGGTGLGLAICKRLIEVMGGQINISSKPGEGSTFFFTLSLPLGHEDMIGSSLSPATPPLAPVSTTADAAQTMVSLSDRPAPAEPPQSQAASGRPLYILVVDDNGINQKVLTSLLDRYGHYVVTASSGNEALGKYLASDYDLVLMDLELPDRSGIEITQDIRALPEPLKAGVPVIAMTGNTGADDIAACYAAGMNDFLAKPIEPDRLAHILSVAGGQGQFARPLSSSAPVPSAPPPAVQPTQVRIIPVKTSQEQAYIPVPPPHTGGDEDEDSFASAIETFERIEAQQKDNERSGTLTDTIDEKMLRTLKDTLDATQMKELMDGFYEKAEELITAIGQAYLQNDLKALGARAHELKGMAGNFGFVGVSQLSAKIEKAAKENRPDDFKHPVDHLGETYAVSKARLLSTL